MSLLSTESLSVFLSPTELVLVRWRGIPRQIVEKRACPVTAINGNGWTGTVEAFANVLREFAGQRLRVILSSHFTHYQLMPWRDDLDDGEEELAVAGLAFTETFGDAAARWRIRLSDEKPGAPRVAAAVEAELLGAIEQAAAAAKTRLVSIQPYLAAAANRWRGHIDSRSSTWLVLHEDYRASLALIEHGRWRWVRCVRVGADWSECLPELVEHEILLAGVAETPAEVLVFAPANPAPAIRKDTRLPFRNLCLEARKGFSPAHESRFGFALIG